MTFKKYTKRRKQIEQNKPKPKTNNKQFLQFINNPDSTKKEKHTNISR